MPDLPGNAPGSMQKLPAGNNAPANTGSKCDANNILLTGAGTGPYFSESGNIGIVINFHRDFECRLQLATNRNISPAQIG